MSLRKRHTKCPSITPSLRWFASSYLMGGLMGGGAGHLQNLHHPHLAGILRWIAMLCSTAQAPKIAGTLLICTRMAEKVCKIAKRRFHRPIACSTITLVFRCAELKFFSASLVGLRNGVSNQVFNGYPESPKWMPLRCWPHSNAAQIELDLSTKLSCEDPG